jgi:hypothetical protein
LSSAILRRQSDSESCGPETNVPLTFVLYHPDCTPRRSDSFVLTCRGERFCIEFTFKLGRSIVYQTRDGAPRRHDGERLGRCSLESSAFALGGEVAGMPRVQEGKPWLSLGQLRCVSCTRNPTKGHIQLQHRRRVLGADSPTGRSLKTRAYF